MRSRRKGPACPCLPCRRRRKLNREALQRAFVNARIHGRCGSCLKRDALPDLLTCQDCLDRKKPQRGTL